MTDHETIEVHPEIANCFHRTREIYQEYYTDEPVSTDSYLMTVLVDHIDKQIEETETGPVSAPTPSIENEP